jgi:hypothetical protein
MTCFLNDGSAQIHIGSGQTPDPSAALEVSAPAKGITLPEIALTSIYDTVIKNPVDGLLIFNTTNDPQNGLYQGIYFWSGKKQTWDQIVTKDTFNKMVSNFAIESAYLVANSTSQSMSSGSTFRTLTFSSPEVLNKNKCFYNNTFTAPEDGFYKIIGGMEISCNSARTTDEAGIQLLFGKSTRNPIQTITERVDASANIPLTPSIFFIGYFQKGETITLQGYYIMTNSPKVERTYFYISAFFK